jgi:hypothetical protein
MRRSVRQPGRLARHAATQLQSFVQDQVPVDDPRMAAGVRNIADVITGTPAGAPDPQRPANVNDQGEVLEQPTPASPPANAHYLEASLIAADGLFARLDKGLYSLFGKASLDPAIEEEVLKRLRMKIGTLRHLRADFADIPTLRKKR